MKIPFCEPSVNKYATYVERVVRENRIGSGEIVEEFEEQLSKYTGAKYAICTTSGTMALFLAAKAIEHFYGRNKFIVPAYGEISVANAAASVGKIAFCGLNDSLKIDKYLMPQDKDTLDQVALMYVDFAGCLDEYTLDTVSCCKDNGIPLIEDAACGIGHSLNGKSAGTFGDIGILSFSVPKLITTGQGGAVLTGSENVAKFIKGYTHHFKPDCLHIGLNLRMTNMQAILGLTQLSNLNGVIARRKQIYSKIVRGISSFIVNTWAVNFTDTVPPLFHTIRTKHANKLIKYLNAFNIDARRNYHSMDRYFDRRVIYYSGGVEKRMEDELVYLPFGNALTDEQIEYMCHHVNRFFNEELYNKPLVEA